MNTSLNSTSTQLYPYPMAAARVLLAMIFVLSGLSKIGAIDGTRGYMEAMHVPGALLWPTLLFEVGAGVLIIVGYRTRLVAGLLAGFCLISAAVFHNQFTDQIQLFMFLKNVSIAGGFVLLACVGAGALSLDARAQKAPGLN
ncbi:DoxX family protein [Variovorax sp. GB1P17]|uniref:DoxX family protein n=1 Tax=Variovorax sp. GB1P17 TaxID=3443740 RepID=UPI003F455DE5